MVQVSSIMLTDIQTHKHSYRHQRKPVGYNTTRAHTGGNHLII